MPIGIPVCSIPSFKDVDDVIRIGNDTVYGLPAAVHTSSLDTAIAVADGLRLGTVWMNSYGTTHHQIRLEALERADSGVS